MPAWGIKVVGVSEDLVPLRKPEGWPASGTSANTVPSVGSKNCRGLERQDCPSSIGNVLRVREGHSGSGEIRRLSHGKDFLDRLKKTASPVAKPPPASCVPAARTNPTAMPLPDRCADTGGRFERSAALSGAFSESLASVRLMCSIPLSPNRSRYFRGRFAGQFRKDQLAGAVRECFHSRGDIIPRKEV